MAEDPDKPPHIETNGTSPTVTVPAPPADNHDTPAVASATATTKAEESHDVELDAQEMVISSLRTQVQDLFSQVTELNNKLVKSYDRVSDLEDDLHVASQNLRSSTVKVSQLEMERTQHLAALNTGFLVEKSHVTSELNRLMEKATEEAAQRGQAESARAAIEKDLDDLSASLFAQANTMVAEARFAQHLSEQKVVQAQQALKGAEEAVGIMQTQMQQLEEEKEEAERKREEIQVKMGKGKWLERIQSVDLSRPMKLMSSHLPYQEFLLFVAHLRSLHQTSPLPPGMATILPLPFLARLSSEDSDPTLRLDLAPSLNWLSRRSVLSAIHTGQLTIEPISVSTLLSESSLSSPVTVAGLGNSDNVPCALCGTPITTVAEYFQTRSQRPSLSQLHNTSWSGSFFKKSTPSITHVSPTQSLTPAGPNSTSSNLSSSQQVYIFRVAPQQSTSISSSLPIPSSIAKSLSQGSAPANSPPYLSPMNGVSSSSSSSGNQPVTIYPLCSSGWCLRRIRSTCTMWAFVRTGIVERVWEEEVPSLLPPVTTAVASVSNPSTPSDTKPPIPPRRRGLWGFASAIGERAVSWSDSDKKKQQHTPSNSVSNPVNAPPTSPQRPPLPPRRDSAAARKLLPPPPEPTQAPSQPPPARLPVTQSDSNTSVQSASSVPPPLPKRSEGRRPTPPKAEPLVLNGEGHDGQQEDGQMHSSPSTPTNKLLFDADSHQSPLKNAKGSPQAAEDALTPPTTDTSASTAEEAKEEKDKADEGAASPSAPTSKRLSLARSTPLPESRPGTPTAGNAVTDSANPPSRTASPATVPAANGAAPPPVPRRAAARRPAPPAPGSRSGTPLQTEVKPTSDENGNKAEDSGEQKPETVPQATEKEDPKEEDEKQESDAKDVFEDAPSQLPTLAAESDAAQPPTLITTSPSPDTVTDTSQADAEKPTAAEEPTKASPEDKPTALIDPSTQTVFTDASSPLAVTKESATLPAEQSSEVPADQPKDQLAAAKGSPLPPIKPVNGSTNGDTKHVASPIQDPNDKEVYIGDMTWEERTWKELVKLREEMFWARIGGSR